MIRRRGGASVFGVAGLFVLMAGIWNCKGAPDGEPPSGLAAYASSSISSSVPGAVAEAEWPAYGRDPGGARHSPLTQITRDNVGRLQRAWTYRSGDIAYWLNHPNVSTFQATPIYVFGSLYVSTGFDRVIALDPETGTERWTYDPEVDLDVRYLPSLTSRGVASWEDPAESAGSCGRRIFLATLDARLVALDAATGLPCAGFGQGGTVDLKAGVESFQPGQYGMTSPPTVIHGTVVVGSMVLDNVGVDVPRGTVRGFDARTGALKWSWDPIPRTTTDPGYDAWSPGEAERARAANVWSVIAADPERGLVFLPTSSPAPDYYGGQRRGPGPHANSIVALRASTGKFVWAFQVVHHDIWDYDVAAPPALTTLHRDGKDTPAVAIATKQGHLFLLDRTTGEPLLPVEERPVPPSDVPGEAASPTQPFPVATPNLTGETRVTPDDAWGLTGVDRAACRAAIANARSEGIFTPPSLRGTIQFPGPLGGVNWGGVAIDEGRGLLITSVNRLPYMVRLIPRSEFYLPLPGEDIGEQAGTPYRMGRRILRGPLVPLPCTKPPWGKLVAVDLATGAIRWDVPLGRMPGVDRMQVSEKWGSMALGGPIVTDGGLAFIAAAMDNVLRAVDVDTGKELWHAPLPTGGQATPMTYRAPSGRQFVVIAAGGSVFLSSPPSDHLIAFALPE